MTVSVVSFSFSRAAQPEAQRPTLLAFSTTSYQQLLWTPTLWHPVLTELYNSSTPTQLPTQSLEWHVWSSSSGNNCHAVQRSLSSGASVYECIMEFLPCPISSAKSAHAISFDYWPLECVNSFRHITLKWPVWPGRRSKYNESFRIFPKGISWKVNIIMWLEFELATSKPQFSTLAIMLWILLPKCT